MPKTIAVRNAKLALNISTGRFISITDSAGKELDGSQATIKPRLLHATSTPSAAPATAITNDSVSNCLTILPRIAPSAARTASS